MAVGAYAATATVSACVPWSDDWESPFAAHSTPDGQIEVLNERCNEDPSLATEFWLWRSDKNADLDDKPTTEWHVVFDKPTLIDKITLGQVPPGATEEVPWPENGLDSFPTDDEYTVKFDLQDEQTDYAQSFQLSDLEGGRIRFKDQNMTPEEFANADPCPYQW